MGRRSSARGNEAGAELNAPPLMNPITLDTELSSAAPVPKETPHTLDEALVGISVDYQLRPRRHRPTEGPSTSLVFRFSYDRDSPTAMEEWIVDNMIYN